MYAFMKRRDGTFILYVNTILGLSARTLEPDPTWIGDQDSNNILPLHSLDPDLCRVTALWGSAWDPAQQWNACRVALTRDHIKCKSGCRSSKSGFRAPVENLTLTICSSVCAVIDDNIKFVLILLYIIYTISNDKIASFIRITLCHLREVFLANLNNFLQCQFEFRSVWLCAWMCITRENNWLI